MFPLVRVSHHLRLLLPHCLFEPNLPRYLALTLAPSLIVANVDNNLTPRLLIERHTLFVLPPDPTPLSLQHGDHRVSEQATVGCGLLQLFDAFELCLLDPLSVRGFEGKFGDVERLIPGFRSCLLGGLRVGVEVLEDSEELEEELSSEVGVCNLQGVQSSKGGRDEQLHTSRSNRSGLVKNFAKK